MKFRTLALSIFLSLAATAGAEEYPKGPVSIVVPYAAGGATEAVARGAAKIMAEKLAKPVLVENKPGANGSIGILNVARSKPDGQTLLYASSAGIILAPLLYSSLRYSASEDLKAVSLLASSPLVLAINADLPIHSVQEFIDYSKSNPGKLNYASTGNGSTYHIASEIFQSLVGGSLTHVPYSGGAPALQDLMAGHVQAIFIVPSKSIVESKRVRILAVSSPERLEMMPAVPTFAELGMPEFNPFMRLGLMVPSGTPSAVIARLEQSANSALKNEEFIKTFKALGYILPGAASAADFERIIAEDTKYWGAVIKEKGIALTE